MFSSSRSKPVRQDFYTALQNAHITYSGLYQDYPWAVPSQYCQEFADTQKISVDAFRDKQLLVLLDPFKDSVSEIGEPQLPARKIDRTKLCIILLFFNKLSEFGLIKNGQDKISKITILQFLAEQFLNKKCVLADDKLKDCLTAVKNYQAITSGENPQLTVLNNYILEKTLPVKKISASQEKLSAAAAEPIGEPAPQKLSSSSSKATLTAEPKQDKLTELRSKLNGLIEKCVFLKTNQGLPVALQNSSYYLTEIIRGYYLDRAIGESSNLVELDAKSRALFKLSLAKDVMLLMQYLATGKASQENVQDILNYIEVLATHDLTVASGLAKSVKGAVTSSRKSLSRNSVVDLKIATNTVPSFQPHCKHIVKHLQVMLLRWNGLVLSNLDTATRSYLEERKKIGLGDSSFLRLTGDAHLSSKIICGDPFALYQAKLDLIEAYLPASGDLMGGVVQTLRAVMDDVESKLSPQNILLLFDVFECCVSHFSQVAEQVASYKRGIKPAVVNPGSFVDGLYRLRGLVFLASNQLLLQDSLEGLLSAVVSKDLVAKYSQLDVWINLQALKFTLSDVLANYMKIIRYLVFDETYATKASEAPSEPLSSAMGCLGNVDKDVIDRMLSSEVTNDSWLKQDERELLDVMSELFRFMQRYVQNREPAWQDAKKVTGPLQDCIRQINMGTNNVVSLLASVKDSFLRWDMLPSLMSAAAEEENSSKKIGGLDSCLEQSNDFREVIKQKITSLKECREALQNKLAVPQTPRKKAHSTGFLGSIASPLAPAKESPGFKSVDRKASESDFKTPDRRLSFFQRLSPFGRGSSRNSPEESKLEAATSVDTFGDSVEGSWFPTGSSSSSSPAGRPGALVSAHAASSPELRSKRSTSTPGSPTK